MEPAISSSATKKLSMITTPGPSASSWNLQPTAIFIKPPRTTSLKRLNIHKNRFGTQPYTSPRDWSRFTIKRYCIETLSQPTSSSWKMGSISSETSTYQKYWRRTWLIPKLAHRSTPVHKFGKISPMVLKAISGPWAVCCMKWQPLSLRLWATTLRDCTAKYVQANSLKFQTATRKSWTI